ncbi:hypothetical protein [Gulosibacter chungangensis]|uniref:Tetratricopeptide repeat protein n=1 Tax=Gulosibacter chungangensis TaxID=979746 RepID=A0A7J5BCG4_9MICO|nr:hypothetical protein [Gulosibacter chungangensis]KAB1643889.1 hypothetical protein F8O05_03545 [Gulosibacter chungangensis]
MTDTSEITAQQYVDRANALYDFGRKPDSILELRKGLSTYPDDPELLSLLSSREFFDGHADEGVTAAKATLTVRPADYRATTVLLEHAVREQRFDEAKQFAKLQVATYPEWGPSYLNLAHVQLNTAWAANRDGKPTPEQQQAWGEEVAANTRKGLELDPEGEETLRRATHLLKDINLKAEAVQTLERGLALYPTSEALQLLASSLQAKDDIEESKILLGVLADNPQQLGAARKLNDNIWARVQYLAAVVPWMLAVLLIVAAFVPESTSGPTTRTERQFIEVFIVVPFAALFAVTRFKRKALPKGYLRRMFSRVWWVWLSFILIAISSALMLLVSLILVLRLQPGTMEHSGPYMGGIAGIIGFVAVVTITAELLLLWARFRSEAKNRLYPVGEQSLTATKYELKHSTWLLVRVGVGLLFALFPLFGAGLANRPETLSAFAAVAIAIMAPPLVRMTWLLARFVNVPGQSARANIIGVIAGLASLIAIVLTSWFTYQHILHDDPPPTPWELEMREQQEKWNDVGKVDIPEFDSNNYTVPEITVEPYDFGTP